VVVYVIDGCIWMNVHCRGGDKMGLGGDESL
jgi:hypothetical protein